MGGLKKEGFQKRKKETRALGGDFDVQGEVGGLGGGGGWEIVVVEVGKC